MIDATNDTALMGDTGPATGVATPEVEEQIGTLPDWYQEAEPWVRAGAQQMLESFYFCDGRSGVGALYGTVVTSTSAVHFGGCRTPSGAWAGGATVYMQPSPDECAWTFYYQTVCGGDDVTLIAQIGPERGFAPDLSGITRHAVPDFELSGRHADDGRGLRYRYMGDPHLGYSTLTDA